MITATLPDIAKLCEVEPDEALSLNGGDVLQARLVPPFPGDNPALGDSIYSLEVEWAVATEMPTVVQGFVPSTNLPTLGVEGTDFIAPDGLYGPEATFVFKPPYTATSTQPQPKEIWLLATFTLRRPGVVTTIPPAPLLPDVYEQKIKASAPITVGELPVDAITEGIQKVFKIEVAAEPIAPGMPITAKLRPKGAEDAEWDVESATEITPNLKLRAGVGLEPFFRPLQHLVSTVFGATNEVLAEGEKLIAALGRAIAKLSGAFGKRTERELRRVLRSMRLRGGVSFRDLELPIDVDVTDRNFTKQLVPRDRVGPLPGPRGLLPSLPSLEDHLRLMDDDQLQGRDAFPAGFLVLPLAGPLGIPLELTGIAWKVTDATGADLLLGSDYYELDHTSGRRLLKTFAFEPPPDDSVYFLEVELTCDVTLESGAEVELVVPLPKIPLRLLGLDLAEFVASQFELFVPTDALEPGEEVEARLLSPLLTATVPGVLEIDLPIGVLPPKRIPIKPRWRYQKRVGDTLVSLQQGEYGVGDATRIARTIVFVPEVRIMRRELPAPAFRYVSVELRFPTLGTGAPVGPPAAIPVLPIQIPMLVAGFKQTMYASGEDRNVIVLPDYYTTQAPAWVASWSALQERLNELKGGVERLLSLAGGPIPFGQDSVRRLTLLRGALDYIANSPIKERRLLFAKTYRGPLGRSFASYCISDAETNFPLHDWWRTVFVFNDGEVHFWPELVCSTSSLPGESFWVETRPDQPVALVQWQKKNGNWTPQTLPGGPDWPQSERIETGGEMLGDDVKSVTFIFSRLAINDYFPGPASLYPLGEES